MVTSLIESPRKLSADEVVLLASITAEEYAGMIGSSVPSDIRAWLRNHFPTMAGRMLSATVDKISELNHGSAFRSALRESIKAYRDGWSTSQRFSASGRVLYTKQVRGKLDAADRLAKKISELPQAQCDKLLSSLGVSIA
jgi:hypothetical protein